MDGMRRLLYPSTIEFIKRRFNATALIAACAAILAVGWIVLLAIGIILNFALEYTLEAISAPTYIRNLLSPMPWIALVALATSMTITSVVDAINLTKVGLQNPDERKDETHQ